MEFVDWLWILHPALAVVVIYPLMGMVVYLARQTRHRRVDRAKLPATVGRNHRDLGKWLATGMVALVLVGIAVPILTKSFWLNPDPENLQALSVLLVHGADHAMAEDVGSPQNWRGLFLLLALAGTVIALAVLWRVQQRWQRILFALLTWAGVLGLGAQPEVWRVSDDPGTFAFWTSHYWTGVGLVALMLFSMAISPETTRRLGWRQVHITVSMVAAVLFVIQGISGTKDLLEIPLGWQKPAIYQCDFNARRCPGAEQTAAEPTVTHPVG
ncbi:MAG: membrane protein [Candidatus Synechococcus spongiarum 142]|uniref:Membrane protein n=1 Tax=Candidatus Synechococcus spongiarum 142 TaxID=1608213 RepID=A0A6N3XA98_9SYNE|nr:MAG: membrane protein [Candidatus Synechococcus spongiarum 142]